MPPFTYAYDFSELLSVCSVTEWITFNRSVICIVFTFFLLKQTNHATALLAVKICKIQCLAPWGVLERMGMELWTFTHLNLVHLNWNAACKFVDGPRSFLCICSLAQSCLAGAAQKSHHIATEKLVPAEKQTGRTSDHVWARSVCPLESLILTAGDFGGVLVRHSWILPLMMDFYRAPNRKSWFL